MQGKQNKQKMFGIYQTRVSENENLLMKRDEVKKEKVPVDNKSRDQIVNFITRFRALHGSVSNQGFASCFQSVATNFFKV